MKPLTLLASILFSIIFSFNAQAQKNVKSESIKVWGNCGMCKKTIETASLNAGASKADWNEETKVLTVSYNEKKTNSQKIQEAVAASGYDTQDLVAPTEVYNKLHSCCQYDRKSVEAVAKSDKMDCCKDMTKCKESGCCKDGKCSMKQDCCKDMTKCKDMSCCSASAEKGAAACKANGCCKDGKCDNTKDCCKDMANCKDMACCKK